MVDTAAHDLDGPVPAGGSVSAAAARYMRQARAESTRRGWRTDIADVEAWAAPAPAWPATPAMVTDYIAAQAQAGASTGTISRRLSTIRTLHRLAGWEDPTDHPLVQETWRGIRNTHGRPPAQARPLMPPDLWDVLAACPTQRVWKSRTREPEPDVAGARDRALLLIGFVGALRRSELTGLRVGDLTDHDLGLVAAIPRSKTNQSGELLELVVLPRSPRPERCPVRAITDWLQLAKISREDHAATPLLRAVSKGNRALTRGLSPAASNVLVQQAIARAGIDPTGYSAHSLRAGFVTFADLAGAPAHAIMHQTRHRSAQSITGYIRLEDAWRHNAATMI